VAAEKARLKSFPMGGLFRIQTLLTLTLKLFPVLTGATKAHTRLP